jgi:hypothetical protein
MVESDRLQMAMQYGAFALNAGQLGLQTHTENIQYLLLFHGKNGYANAHQCYVIRTVSVLFLTLDRTA